MHRSQQRLSPQRAAAEGGKRQQRRHVGLLPGQQLLPVPSWHPEVAAAAPAYRSCARSWRSDVGHAAGCYETDLLSLQGSRLP